MHAVAGFLIFLSLVQAAPQATVGRITGRLAVEGTDAPIVGARVTIFPARMPSGPVGPLPQTVTDQDGRFVFDRIAPGTYRVDAQRTGYAPLSDRAADPVQVVAGESIAIDLHLQRGAAITGRVFDPSGAPMTDARIMAMRRLPVPPSMPSSAARLLPVPGNQGGQQTNDLGEFRVSGLAPGEYYIVAMSRELSPFGGLGVDVAQLSAAKTTIATTLYPGTTDQAAALPIAVTAGAEVGNIVFTMQSTPAFRVSGVVVDESGKPVAGAMVMMFENTGMFMGWSSGHAQSGPDGQFAISEVPAGSYRLMASIPVSVSGSGAGFVSFSSGVVVTGGVVGGVVGGAGDAADRPTEIVVADADVTGVRVAVRRPR